MLIAIDLQNDIFDENGTGYAESTKEVRDGIEARIRQAIGEGESVLYTRNLYPEFEQEKRSLESIRFDEEIFPQFGQLLEDHGDEYVKTFYGIPPEEARKIQKKYGDEVETNRTVEFVGAETNVCVLANIMVIQNIFPQADITLNKDLAASTDRTLHDKTIDVLSNMNVFIIGKGGK
ncbi:cysteine hydrolase family protein [Salinicoccus roseus]|uniref:cysteine hydrolase family protein n=1 Tax=Salinicoccus roseus TaxID=45670 RepID=UPI0035231478